MNTGDCYSATAASPYAAAASNYRPPDDPPYVQNQLPAPTRGERPEAGAGDKGTDVKYMIMMFAGLGGALQDRDPGWVTGMHQLLMGMDQELRDSGELVDSQKMMDPAQAVTVRFDNGAPLPTDGPYAEVKESLAGYWIVEASQERAVEITSRVVTYTEFPMEVRRIMDAPPQL